MNNKSDSEKIEDMICDYFHLKKININIDAMDNLGYLYEIKACKKHTRDNSHKSKIRNGRFWFSDKDFELNGKKFIFVVYDKNGSNIEINNIKIMFDYEYINKFKFKKEISWKILFNGGGINE